MSSSTICFALFALVASTYAAPSGWPVVTYAQSYSAHAVDHSVAQSVYPAVAAAPVLPAAVAEPLIAPAQRLLAAPQPLVAAPQRLVAAPQPLLAASPYYASAAPLVASPYVAW
ncbi:hypothetical protein GE061_010230 [Apolygus lucorum]|uniref:Cuticle protein n=1 Tax=Apolygus lucorum TaxID=248454 RepID=A0A6A4K7U5_APOLU|nr:hypothetical protein GE061_010230 [Apolygus lucorum]